MPHFPARIIKDRATLTDWVARYKDVGVKQGLLLAGGVAQPMGDFSTSMQLLESGAFSSFTRLHVAGHPEGNKDIDPDGSDRMVMEAARWKSAFMERTDAQMAMATQFCFEAQPVIDWVNRLAAEGVKRQPGMAGAGLLVLVVAKLFFIDLSNVGGIERSISWLCVGVLMLAIGYLAPFPREKSTVAE